MGNVKVARCVAAALVVALGVPLAPCVRATQGTASLGGRVVTAGTEASLAGARVHVGDERTSRIVTSGVTGADGAFEVAGLAPAAYQLAVESGGGLYVVETPLRLAPGESRSVQLALSQEPAAGGEKDKEKKKSAAAMWNNPLVATAVVVGVAVVVGLIVGKSTGNEPASPSAP
jgi:hypothetical protein